jgi:hypothetical protein
LPRCLQSCQKAYDDDLDAAVLGSRLPPILPML